MHYRVTNADVILQLFKIFGHLPKWDILEGSTIGNEWNYNKLHFAVNIH